MSAYKCKHAQRDMVASQSAKLDSAQQSDLTEHLKACASCRDDASVLQGGLDALRHQAPPVDPIVKQRQILNALDKARPSNRGLGLLRPALLGAGALAAAFLMVFMWSSQAPPPAVAQLLSGQVQQAQKKFQQGENAPLGQALAVAPSGRAELQLDDDSRVLVTANSEFKLSEKHGWRVDLALGSVTCSVTPQSGQSKFRVMTPELELQVVGTRFTVERTVGLTTVKVEQGLVQIRTKNGKSWAPLGAGETREVRPVAQKANAQVPPSEITETPPQQVEASTDKVKTKTKTKTKAKASASNKKNIARRVRDKLSQGKVGEARVAIAESRRLMSGGGGTGTGTPSGRWAALAELDLLEAEADLAEKQYKKAIARYLEVHRRYRSSIQSETALFAAAQLAIDHSSRRQALDLLDRYLSLYPNGRFAVEARALYQAMKP